MTVKLGGPRPAGAGADAALAFAWFMGGVINRPLPPLRRLASSVAGMTTAGLWSLPDAELAALFRLTALERERLAAFRTGFSPAARRAELERVGVRFAALGEAAYPRCLEELFDPAPGIFAIGGLEPLARLGRLTAGRRLAVVGARAASRYGLDAAEHLAGALTTAGVCIVSGLAYGIDAAAHQAAIENAGATIAVLGCGPDRIYPRAHAALYRQILKSGVIISEYPPGTGPLPWRFPARNRIIAGISEGVVVVEAREKSGALITADFCLEQGKEVFAVPGSIFAEQSAGPHRLIRNGATPATRPEDVFEALGIAVSGRESEATVSLGEDEMRLLGEMAAEYRHLDVLAETAGLASGAAAAAMVALEVKGLARHAPGRGYARRFKG